MTPNTFGSETAMTPNTFGFVEAVTPSTTENVLLIFKQLGLLLLFSTWTLLQQSHTVVKYAVCGFALSC